MNNKNTWISVLVLSLSTAASGNPDTPSPVTMITLEDIESLTDLTFNDILGSVPAGLGEPGGLDPGDVVPHRLAGRGQEQQGHGPLDPSSRLSVHGDPPRAHANPFRTRFHPD